MGAESQRDPVLKYQDLITVHDRADTLGNDNGSSARERFCKLGTECCVGLVIKGTRGIIENQEFRVSRQSPCNEDAPPRSFHSRLPRG